MANTKRKSTVTPSQIVAARGRMTQREAAAAMGVTERTWRNWERGVVSMRKIDYDHFSKNYSRGQ